MTTTVEKLSPTRVKLTTTLDEEQLKPSITHAYEHIAADVTIPGFRKGKVPPAIIDARIGKAYVLEHAINDAIDPAWREAAAETEVRPLGRPEVNVESLPDATSFTGDLVLVFEVDVRPEIELPTYEGLKITVDASEVDDADVDVELDRLRSRFGTLVSVDRPATNGDFATIDLEATIDGEVVDSAEGISYELGSGDLLEGMDEALDSLTAGEATTFSSKLLGGDHEGEEAEINVTVTAVKERELPEADDDFAQIASEFDTIAELRESLKAEAGRSKIFAQGNDARNKLVDALLEAVEIPIPEAVIEAQVNDHLERENRQEDDTHRAEVDESSRKSLRVQILLDTLAEKLAVQVSQQEFTGYVIQASAQYGIDPNEFVKALVDDGQISGIVAEVARNKAIAIALGKTEVVDSNGKAIDLTGFVAVQEETSAEAAESAGTADSAGTTGEGDTTGDGETEADADADDSASDTSEYDSSAVSKKAERAAKKAAKKKAAKN